MRVLLVEDSDTLRFLFARVLESQAAEVREAADGQQALDALLDFEPDLILTDLMMPVMGGIELIRRVRAMPALDAVPVVAITAHATAAVEQEAREAGAVDFIVKPVEIPTLLERLYGLRT